MVANARQVLRLATGGRRLAAGRFRALRLLSSPTMNDLRTPPHRYVHRVVNLVPDESQELWDLTLDEARSRVLANDPEQVLAIAGSFALVARDGEIVRLARSLDRPLRYFLAKEVSGPLLVVADRIDAIREFLEGEGYGDQFHPSYTRMVPAHHVTTLQLIGCPDPNPVHTRFFAPERATAEADPESLGGAYVGAMLEEIDRWLDAIPGTEPIGVLFSGGIDSGAVLLGIYHRLLARGESPARLKAFTLDVEGAGADANQAREFLRALDLEMLGETIPASVEDLDPMAAVALIEDYKARDVECATVNLALLRALRDRYPDWKHLADGDGGDENLKDYPIEENAELTIRSVVSNSMLYQEGWGVEAIKHSLTYSGGQSRGCVRSWAPARACGFRPFSPLTRPSVVAAAERIPFAALTDGSHERLYALKGEIVGHGIRRHLGVEMPVFPKRRFQEGAVPEGAFRAVFSAHPEEYRSAFLALHRR